MLSTRCSTFFEVCETIAAASSTGVTLCVELIATEGSKIEPYRNEPACVMSRGANRPWTDTNRCFVFGVARKSERRNA